MKAENERVEGLKIGNLVSAITCDGSEVVDMVSELILVDDSVFFKTLKGWSKGRPIPLTEDWLLNFGLVRGNGRKDWFSLSLSESVYFYYHLDIKYSGIVQHDEYSEYANEIGNLETNYIKYVHQLQNLYFALTGKELTIKE